MKAHFLVPIKLPCIPSRSTKTPCQKHVEKIQVSLEVLEVFESDYFDYEGEDDQSMDYLFFFLFNWFKYTNSNFSKSIQIVILK